MAEMGAWMGTYAHHLGYVLGAVAVSIGILWLLTAALQPLVLPLLDEVRGTVRKVLESYIKNRAIKPASTEDAIVIAACVVAGAITSSTILLGMVLLIVNVATPLG